MAKYSLVLELKYTDNKDNPNREVCTSDNRKLLEEAAVNMVKSPEVPVIVPFESELDGKLVTGVAGFQRNAYIVDTDQIEKL